MEQTKPGTIRRLAAGLGIGAVCALIAAGVLTCLFAGVLALGAPDGLITIFAYMISAFAAFAGGFFAGRKMREGGLKVGLLAGAVTFLLHLLCMLCFGSVSPVCLTFLPVELLCGVVGGILAVNLRR